jgi:hypothetical protein
MLESLVIVTFMAFSLLADLGIGKKGWIREKLALGRTDPKNGRACFSCLGISADGDVCGWFHRGRSKDKKRYQSFPNLHSTTPC